jgi:hypothetical protein
MAKKFKQWAITPSVTPINGTSLTSETVTFNMPEGDVTATAAYNDVFNVTITNGTASTANPIVVGTAVTLTAKAPT